jgi:uncharacterized protein YecT (DUF1311 family)
MHLRDLEGQTMRAATSSSVLAPLALGLLLPLLTPVPARAAEDCDDLYDAGPADPAAFPAALKCYEAAGDFGHVVLMHLNGEGAQPGVAKGAEVLAAHMSELGMEGEMLAKAVAERKADPAKTWPRLSWCKDVAATTITMNDCADLDERRAEKALKQTVLAIGRRLPGDAQGAYDALAAAFVPFKEAEAAFMYQEYVDGSIRNMAAMSQAEFVRERYNELLRKVVEDHALPPATKAEHDAADKELNQAYKARLADYAESATPANAKAQAEAGRKAQRLWIRYRDAWAKLAEKLYGADGALRAATLATKVRVLELRNSPVGGG